MLKLQQQSEVCFTIFDFIHSLDNEKLAQK